MAIKYIVPEANHKVQLIVRVLVAPHTVVDVLQMHLLNVANAPQVSP